MEKSENQIIDEKMAPIEGMEAELNKVPEQVIEVDYNKEMVIEDQKATEENNQILLEQDTFNEDGIEELLGEGAEVDEYKE